MNQNSLKYRILKQIPNALTLGRFVLTVIFLTMLLVSPAVPKQTLWIDWAFILFVYTGLTDAIDGHLARRLNVTSKFGRTMDPLADKILVCGTYICLALINKPILFPEIIAPITQQLILWLTAIIIVARETLVQFIRQKAEDHNIQFGANIWGKLKMFVQSFGIGTVLIKMAHVPDQKWTYWFTAVVYTLMIFATIMSGLQYIARKDAVKAAFNRS